MIILPRPTKRKSPRVLSFVLKLVTLLSVTTAAQSASALARSTVSARQYFHGAYFISPGDTTYSKASDLRLMVDTRWTNNHGYRPIRLRVVSRQIPNTERRFRIRLHIAGTDKAPLDVEQSFELPQGVRETTAVVRVPELFGDDRCWWDVWVDGVRDPELSATEAESRNVTPAGTSRSQGTTLAFMVVHEDAQPSQLIAVNTEPIAGVIVAPDDLPTAWIDYNALDVVAMTPRELEQLEATRPEALAALRRWVRAGGQLWVYSVGQDAEHLADVERCLELTNARPLPEPFDLSDDNPAASKVINEHDAALAARGWRPLPIGAGDSARTATFRNKATGRVETVRDAALIALLKVNPAYEAVDNPAGAATAPVVANRDTARWYLERPLGLGRVRVFRGGFDPVGLSTAYRMLGGGLPNQPPFEPAPPTPVTTAIETTRDWPKRHGLTPDLASADFADFLVPGVGLAPVTEFRVLITLFVLAIGPLNYWLLMRANRLHLLLLTVPVLALGLTAALFGYAFVSDGIGTVVRVRSFTSLDQTTGEATSWARLSYYAGLAPGEGLELDDDVAVFPIRSEWGKSDERDFDNRHELQRRQGRQVFSKGWLRSRTPTQYLTVRARKSPARIEFARAEDKLLATNQLGAPILYLAVVDESGNVYSGEAIDDNTKIALQPSTHSDALRILRDWMLQNQPQMPPELLASRASSSKPGPPRRFFRGPGDPDVSVAHMSDNVLNTALADLVAGNAEGVLNVPRRSYIAITETGPEIELGLEDATEEASFHVLQGTW